MVQIIAHRGLRSEKPENTLAAISDALQLSGVHGVEFDVELTLDKQPIVLHQETVVPNASFTGIEPAARDFTLRDWVIETSAEVALRMDAGSWMSAEFAHLKIPTLKQVLALPWQQKTAYVELKDATYWGKRDKSRPAQVVEASLLSLSAFQGPINVISFNPEILRLVRSAISQVPTTLALWTEWRWRKSDAIKEAKSCGASTISLPDVVVLEDPEWSKAAHEQGIKVHTYPVSPARGEPDFLNWTAASQTEKWQRLNQLGVDAIISDFARETSALLAPITFTN